LASTSPLPGNAPAASPRRRPLALKVDIAQASDPGRDPNKQVNEDSCGFSESRFGHLMVLCDGMGGHYGGQEASRRAITTIFETLERMPETMPPGQALKASIEEAARRVYELGGGVENKVRPGSTVVAMLLHDGGLDVAHVGDSRAYIIRSNQIYPLTRDHSMVQGLIDAGYITEEQAIGHPDSNKITRALGMKPEVDVELRPEPMEVFPGDLMLQASDGLTDLALGPDILAATRQALASGDLTYACNQLVRLANDRGGHDNITVQIVRILAVGPKVGATVPGAPVGPTNPGAPAGQSMHGAGHPGGQGAAGADGVPKTQMGAPATVAPTVAGPPTRLDDSETHVMAHSPAAGLPPVGTPQPGGVVAPTWNATGVPGPAAGSAPAGHTHSGQQGMAPYQMGAPQQLPLPPPAAGSHVASTVSSSLSPGMGGAGQGMGHPSHSGVPAAALASGALAGVNYPVPLARPFAPKKRGQIIYLILGLSVLVALLLLALVWALFLR
jgi:serine/threonine protein phosphatase PrpC